MPSYLRRLLSQRVPFLLLSLLVTAGLTLPVSAHANQAPRISGTPTTTMTAGTFYNFTPSASDANGDTLRFSISNRPVWSTFNSTTGALTGRPTSAQVGNYPNITIRVSDGKATTSLPAFAISVRVASGSTSNAAPRISGTPATSVVAGTFYNFTPSASDANGDKLTFSISNRPVWSTFNTSTGALTGRPTSAQVGNYPNITIRVSDGKTTTALPAFTISVSATSGGTSNTAPRISGTPATSVVAGTFYNFTPSASDANGDKLTFSISNRPVWSTFNTSTGALTGRPTSAQVGNYSNITIRVSDGKTTTALPAFTISVRASSGGSTSNTAPRISGSPTTSVRVGTAYNFTPTASDDNGDTLTFSISNRPAWASFNTSTGRLSGTPTSAQVGAYSNITIRVSDGKATATLPAFQIVVSEVASGSATLNWTPPTRNTNGTSLTNLSGYRIVYGTSTSAMNKTININNVGVTTYVVENLSPATYYFAVRSVNSSGAESALSTTVSKTVR